MQLSSLIARLRADDRKTLIERRLGPDVTAIDNASLVTRLADPRSVASALAELNATQLLILRWLGGRPGLEVIRQELLDALGDRLDPELREAYLTDLRLWGLAFYDPDPRRGTLATYPALVAAIPAPRGIPLERRLGELTSDVLAKTASALGLKNLPSRKDARLRLVLETLTTTESCRAAVDRLSKPARELFAWLREQGGSVSAAQMSERTPIRRHGYGVMWGSATAWWSPPPRGQQLDPLTELVRCHLVIPITPYPGSWYAPSQYVIPEEVELAYAGRTLLESEPLQPPRLESAEPTEPAVPSVTNLLRDIGHLLGFVESGRCEWRQDGQPYKRSLTALGKLLGSKDGAYAEQLWELALWAGLVRGPYGSSRPSVAMIDATPGELFQGLLVGWIEGRYGAPPGGRITPGQLARTHLLQLLSMVPPDTWILKRSIEAWLRFQWPLLFRPGPQHGQGAPPDPGWAALSALLLGRGKTADGDEVIMLPADHSRLLDPSNAQDASLMPPWDEGWIVQPDRSVIAPPNLHPNAVKELWRVAQLESSHGASMFRVTPSTVAGALNQGLTPERIRSILASRSRVPLPPTVERLIEDQGRRYGRIKVGSAATYVRTDDPALLDELRRHGKLQKLEWREVAPGVAFVVSSDPVSVLQALRGAGYLPVLEQSEAEKATAAREVALAEDAAEHQPLLEVIGEAIERGETLSLTWVERGRNVTAEVEPIDLHRDGVHVYNLDTEQESTIPFGAIVDVRASDDLDDLDDDLSEALEMLLPKMLKFPKEKESRW